MCGGGLLATLRVLSVCASKDLLVATMLVGTRVCLGIFSCFVVCAGVFFVQQVENVVVIFLHALVTLVFVVRVLFG